jgi:hypothetical protein|tara:strand:+ start:108 stop:581 length:474 start_codon:yes stop_codon:yes gene_type:complete
MSGPGTPPSSAGLQGIFDLLAKGGNSIPASEAVDAVRMASCNPTGIDVIKIRGVVGSRAVNFDQYAALVRNHGGGIDQASFAETFASSGLVSDGECSLQKLEKIVRPRSGVDERMDSSQWDELIAEGRRKGLIRGTGKSARVEVAAFCRMLFSSDGP